MAGMDIINNLGGGGFSIGKYFPNFSGFGSSMLMMGIVIITLGILGFLGYLYWDNKKYIYKIEFFENLGGVQYQRVAVGKAKILKIGNQGEEILITKKKQLLNSHNKKMGVNLLWFAKGQDGMWINILLGDLDVAKGMLDIVPVDRDMRLAHVSIRKATDNEFKKTSFMDKYGSYLMMGIFLIIIIIGIGYLVNKMGATATLINEGLKTSVELAKQNQAILSAMDNVCSGSGIVAA